MRVIQESLPNLVDNLVERFCKDRCKIVEDKHEVAKIKVIIKIIKMKAVKNKFKKFKWNVKFLNLIWIQKC